MGRRSSALTFTEDILGPLGRGIAELFGDAYKISDPPPQVSDGIRKLNM
jgi:hypothetical protein